MPHFTVILFALVSLAVITCKATPWNGNYNSNPAKNNDHLGNYKGYNNAYWKPAQKTSSKLNYSAKVADVSKKNDYNYYIQVLVLVDYSLYSVYNNTEEMRQYVKSFWKSVDLRYKPLKISLSLAGIIIAETPFSTPYLQENIVYGNFVDGDNALTGMGKYLYSQKNLPLYDIAVQMTKLDFCRDPKGYRTCGGSVVGNAVQGGACRVDLDLEEVNSIAIVHDSGGYDGVISAAHEFGHLLGAHHDGPGFRNYALQDGYIMGKYKTGTSNMFHWSSCSKQSIFAFLKTETAQCLLDGPHENSFEGIPLPGETMSLDDQCLRDRGTKFFDHEPLTSVCEMLPCYNSNEPDSEGAVNRPAAEGSPCGEGLHCLNGKCVSQRSNGPYNYGH